MYIFKGYNNSTIAKFQKRESFIEYLNQQSDMKDLEFDDCKYFENFENDCDFKSIDGYVFDGFSLGWCAEQKRYKLLGYWTKIPCDDDNI